MSRKKNTDNFLFKILIMSKTRNRDEKAMENAHIGSIKYKSGPV